jgi:hypothetical protein
MAYVEQLLYGHNHLTEMGGRQELARSAGIGAEVAAEVQSLCDAWGQAPELGLQHPALLSHPLKSTMPSMRGRLYTVICVIIGEPTLFHAVILSDATYSGFGRNPYAVARAMEFRATWNGRSGMDRIEIDHEGPRILVEPAAHAGDVGLVDQAVLQFILSGNLQLPIEQSVRDSDRAMALIIACLPEKARKELNFASFTTTKANAYHIAGLETEGATFASWHRLMMARIDSGVTDQQQEYKDHIAEYLARGDMAGITRVSSRHNFSTVAQKPSVVATRPTIEPTRTPPAPPRVTPPPASFGRVSTMGPSGPAASSGSVPARRPMLAATAVSTRRGLSPEHGLTPATSSAGPSHGTRSRWQRNRVGAPFARHRRGKGGRVMRTVSVLLLLFVAGWVGTMWLEGRTLAESLEWAGLPGMDGRTDSVQHAGTLLEVVDVGRVYGRALKNTGGSTFGLNPSLDRSREKALSRLQSGATKPLLDQVALFVKLSNEGIQQSGRQDREVERLDSLAKQGAVLEKEMARLELAWYSLATSTNWKDLGKLSDADVVARRDSLDSVENGALADVRLAMGTEKTWHDLAAARRHMNGMAAVVSLFQAEKWSPSWEKKLGEAAEKVSPAAGQTNRAYRNSAFALLRLKRAERKAANRNLPFDGRFSAGQWPSAQVKSILPALRKEAGRFSDQNAPKILGATISLYTSLEAPEKSRDRILSSARQWQQLQDNVAARFDAELYANFLERLRYEAADRRLKETQDPAQIPEHLYRGEARWAVAAFADTQTVLAALPVRTQAARWRAMSTTAQVTFLGRWADHLASKVEGRIAALEADFNVAWSACRVQAVALQDRAVAGLDWTAAWQELHQTAQQAYQRFPAALSEDAAQQARFAYLAELIQVLEAPRPLQVTRTTVRLDPAVITAPTEVQVELRTPNLGAVWTSKPFAVGPAAPAGSGWVGTIALNWTVPLSAAQKLTARVLNAADQGVLLEIEYPSQSEGMGPAGLERPKVGAVGSLSFSAELEPYWRSLQVPEPGPVF